MVSSPRQMSLLTPKKELGLSALAHDHPSLESPKTTPSIRHRSARSGLISPDSPTHSSILPPFHPGKLQATPVDQENSPNFENLKLDESPIVPLHAVSIPSVIPPLDLNSDPVHPGSAVKRAMDLLQRRVAESKQHEPESISPIKPNMTSSRLPVLKNRPCFSRQFPCPFDSEFLTTTRELRHVTFDRVQAQRDRAKSKLNKHKKRNSDEFVPMEDDSKRCKTLKFGTFPLKRGNSPKQRTSSLRRKSATYTPKSVTFTSPQTQGVRRSLRIAMRQVNSPRLKDGKHIFAEAVAEIEEKVTDSPSKDSEVSNVATPPPQKSQSLLKSLFEKATSPQSHSRKRRSNEGLNPSQRSRHDK